jgi:hypothetical protein
MSDLDEICLYCEDEERRPTVRLLFLALEGLKGDIPLAEAIGPRPTGSKEDVKVRVRHARRDKVRAFSVRDRDFLDRSRVDEMRWKALRADWRTAEPWPLSRHAIESYLLDPRFLAQALPSRTEAQWRTLLDEMAEARKWTDLLRAALVDLRWRISRVEWAGTDSLLASRDEALTELSLRFAQTRAAIEAALREPDARAKFESLEKDFAADGPLVHRVDGKRLLKALDERLVQEGSRRAEGLLGFLLTHAERHGCPQALLDDLRPLLVEVGAVHASWR